MWYQQELGQYANETRAAVSLFLPLPDGLTAREFDQAARARRLSGIGRAWENSLLASCRLLAISVPSGTLPDTLRHARKLAAHADGFGYDAMARLDPTLPNDQAKAIRDDRARRALRRAFGLNGYSDIRTGRNGVGTSPQRQRSDNTPFRS